MEDSRWILESHINGLHAEIAELERERDSAREALRELAGAADRLLDCDLDRVCLEEGVWPPKDYEHVGEVETAIEKVPRALEGRGDDRGSSDAGGEPRFRRGDGPARWMTSSQPG